GHWHWQPRVRREGRAGETLAQLLQRGKRAPRACRRLVQNRVDDSRFERLVAFVRCEQVAEVHRVPQDAVVVVGTLAARVVHRLAGSMLIVAALAVPRDGGERSREVGEQPAVQRILFSLFAVSWKCQVHRCSPCEGYCDLTHRPQKAWITRANVMSPSAAHVPPCTFSPRMTTDTTTRIEMVAKAHTVNCSSRVVFGTWTRRKIP